MADQLDAVPSYRKLKLENPLTWDHHRGGWKYAIQLIQEELHCDDGTLMISSVEDVVFEEKVTIVFVQYTHAAVYDSAGVNRRIFQKTWIFFCRSHLHYRSCWLILPNTK